MPAKVYAKTHSIQTKRNAFDINTNNRRLYSVHLFPNHTREFRLILSNESCRTQSTATSDVWWWALRTASIWWSVRCTWSNYSRNGQSHIETVYHSICSVRWMEFHRLLTFNTTIIYYGRFHFVPRTGETHASVLWATTSVPWWSTTSSVCTERVCLISFRSSVPICGAPYAYMRSLSISLYSSICPFVPLPGLPNERWPRRNECAANTTLPSVAHTRHIIQNFCKLKTIPVFISGCAALSG